MTIRPLSLLTVLGGKPPAQVVTSTNSPPWLRRSPPRDSSTGESISGNPLGLRIAAGNVPNLVDPATGKWGKVLLDPINSTQTTTLANLNTLGSLITAFVTVANDDWRARFLKAATPTGGATPKNTLEAMAGIAREPWADPKTLYALFDEAYPQPKDGSRRAAPFVPYLAWTPPDFALSLCFAGGGVFANGRFMFDANGNLWSGQNWMPGSQSGVSQKHRRRRDQVDPQWDRALSADHRLHRHGHRRSRLGHRRDARQGLDHELQREDPRDGLRRPSDRQGERLPLQGETLGLMGVGIAANGDVWIADGSDDQLLHFPGGRVKDGRIVKVAGLKSPFDIVIDDQNRVWVSNSSSDTVVRFPADDPSKVESFRTGISVRGLALDSKNNVWVASNMLSLDFPVPKFPTAHPSWSSLGSWPRAALHYPKATGVINLIRPDGTQPAPAGFTGGGAVDIPWGLNIDGNDDVWIGNLLPRTRAVVLMAGADPKGHPAGTKTGDVIHMFQGGSIQMLTDVSIDPAGNVWAANNWNDPRSGGRRSIRSSATSTWGGGSGFTVIYGVAAPVKPPRMGKVRTY